jgi:hypothetical protein
MVGLLAQQRADDGLLFFTYPTSIIRAIIARRDTNSQYHLMFELMVEITAAAGPIVLAIMGVVVSLRPRGRRDGRILFGRGPLS